MRNAHPIFDRQQSAVITVAVMKTPDEILFSMATGSMGGTAFMAATLPKPGKPGKA